MRDNRDTGEDYNRLKDKLPTILKSDAALTTAFKTVDAEVKRIEANIKELVEGLSFLN